MGGTFRERGSLLVYYPEVGQTAIGMSFGCTPLWIASFLAMGAALNNGRIAGGVGIGLIGAFFAFGQLCMCFDQIYEIDREARELAVVTRLFWKPVWKKRYALADGWRLAIQDDVKSSRIKTSYAGGTVTKSVTHGVVINIRLLRLPHIPSAPHYYLPEPENKGKDILEIDTLDPASVLQIAQRLAHACGLAIERSQATERYEKTFGANGSF